MADVNDLVLVHVNREAGFFARIEAVEPDVKRGWLQVSLLVLTMPPQVKTWILRPEYLEGEEFTMDGVPMRMEKVVPPGEPRPAPHDPGEEREPSSKVVPIFDKKRGD